MSIQSIKTEFREKRITKQELALKMHSLYQVLFDFAACLPGTEIQDIDIADGKVFFTTRQTTAHPGGVKFFIDPLDVHVTPLTAFSFDRYEEEDSNLLYALVSDGDTIFDIGANIGWHSLHLSRKLPFAKIYAFEPIPDVFEQLQENVAINDTHNIVVNNLALSDTKQVLTFYSSPAIRGASSSANLFGDETIRKMECPADTLDHYVAENGISQIDFIKCDVEGAELLVYKGAVASIDRFRPVVFSEMLRKWAAKFGYHPNDIIDLFGGLGYQCYTAGGPYLEPFGRVTEETVETNYFFLDPQKHAALIAQFKRP